MKELCLKCWHTIRKEMLILWNNYLKVLLILRRKMMNGSHSTFDFQSLFKRTANFPRSISPSVSLLISSSEDGRSASAGFVFSVADKTGVVGPPPRSPDAELLFGLSFVIPPFVLYLCRLRSSQLLLPLSFQQLFYFLFFLYCL